MLVQCCSLLKQCQNNVAVLRQKSWLRIVSCNIIFRFQDENDYEYEISSILRSARAWNSVILAGKRDSLRHSTTSFSENVVVSYPSGEGSTSFKKDNNATLSTWSFPGCLFFWESAKKLSVKSDSQSFLSSNQRSLQSRSLEQRSGK